MTDETGADEPEANRRSARRRFYIKERLPAILAEMKSMAEERAELIAKRKEVQLPEERRQINQRWNFLVERLAALRAERAALIDERDGMPSQPGKTRNKK